MKKLRVLVIGGRFMPHIIGLVAAPPDKVEMIISKDSKGQPEQAYRALKSFPHLEIYRDPIFIDAYNIREAREACRSVAERNKDFEITFDITSSAKIPSFAARDVAREGNHRLIFVDSYNHRIINVVPEQSANIVEIQLNLDDYLNCYGRRAVNTFQIDKISVPEKNAYDLSTYLSTGGTQIAECLALLRSSAQGKGKRTIPFRKSKPLSVKQYEVFKEVENYGFISQLQRDSSGRISFQLANDFDFKFLEGGWLEYFVFVQAKSCKDENGNAVFSDVQLSVEIPSNGERKEIDVACIYRGQLLHVSCKTASPFKTAHLDELRAVSDLVGGDFATRMFVTNNYPPTPEKAPKEAKKYKAFLAHAEARKVIVVCGDRLSQISSILKQQATRPTYSRI